MGGGTVEVGVTDIKVDRRVVTPADGFRGSRLLELAEGLKLISRWLDMANVMDCWRAICK